MSRLPCRYGSGLTRSMIKSELVLRIAEQNPHLYEKDAEAVVNTILGRISDALVAGDRVELRGFGAFTIRSRNARLGREPQDWRSGAGHRQAGPGLQNWKDDAGPPERVWGAYAD